MAKQQMLQMIPSKQSAVVYDNFSYPLDRNKEKNALDEQHPALLGHYHNLEKIGHGAQATMLKALDKADHPVAIKLFEYQKASEWKEFELFEREISVLKDLDIHGVPKYIETIKADNCIYLVEEYIDALSLEKQLNKGRIFSVDECVVILKNIAKILQLLGNRIPPIVHRDIKPANILADKQLNVYLVDFGVVANTVQTISMTFAGTAGYVAPEQLYGKTTPASDIFSLGATMLHLVTRVAPCDMKLKGFLPDFDKYIPSSVPGWFGDLIIKMMSPDPESRPQNGDALVKLIEAGQARYLKESEVKTRSHAEPADTHNLMVSADAAKEQSVEKQADEQKDPTPAKIDTFFVVYVVVLCVMISGVVIFQSLSDNNSRRESSIPDFSSEDSSKDYSSFGFIPELEFMDGVADYNKRNYTSALRHFKTAATKGYKDAQYKLGQMYAEGEGVEKNYDEALNWYKKAAEQGDPDAQYSLGCLYSHPEKYGKDPLREDILGWDISVLDDDDAFRNYDEAVKWYEKAAWQGHVMAQYTLGNMYAKGEGVKKDLATAARWFTSAANQGNADAQYALGVMYLNGDGVTRDEAYALDWIKKAAESGHADANSLLQSRQFPKEKGSAEN